MSDVIAELSVTHTRRAPVFVIGYARSGTSLMCRLLRRYLKVSFGTESQFIIRYYQRLSSYGDLSQDANVQRLITDISRERFFTRSARNWGFVFDPCAAFTRLEARTYSAVLDAIFSQLAAHNGMQRWGDKTPQYSHHLPTLLELFPDAQFVHVVRDGRDVTLSIGQTPFGPKNAYETAVEWAQALGRIRAFADKLPPQQFIEVRYEDLIERPADALTRLAEYLGIDDRDGMLSAYISRHVRNDIVQGNSEKWRTALHPREIERFEAVGATALLGSGYEPAFNRPARRISALEGMWWRARGSVARLLIVGYWKDTFYQLAVRARSLRDRLTARRRTVAEAGSSSRA